MNYPKQQERKSLLKKLITERKDEIAILKAEIAYFFAFDPVEFRPEINLVKQNLKKSLRDLRVLERMAAENKREIAIEIESERFLKALYEEETSDEFALLNSDVVV